MLKILPHIPPFSIDIFGSGKYLTKSFRVFLTMYMYPLPCQGFFPWQGLCGLSTLPGKETLAGKYPKTFERVLIPVQDARSLYRMPVP